jgi:hypothetical protein
VTKHYDAKKLHEAEQDNMIVAALGAGYFLNDEETKYGEYNKTQNQPFSPWLEQRKR